MAASRSLRRSLWSLRPPQPRLNIYTTRHVSSAAAAAAAPESAAPYPPLTEHIHHNLPPLDRREAISQAPAFSSFLTDTFGRQHDYLRISLTERCNLRCTYCMPESGVPLSPPSELLTSAEIVYLSSLFVAQGVQKIRLTGGEPTVRKDFLALLGQIGALKSKGLKELAITTNGLVLERRLERMVEAGLTGVNISLDTMDPGMFQIMTRRKGWENVMRGIEKVLKLKEEGAGVKLKVNCVVMRGVNDREVVDFVEFTRDRDIEVRFIEYMPFDGNKWSKKKMVSYGEMVDMIREKYPTLRRVGEGKNETSKTWEVPGFKGKLGFITSMTHNFCGTCNRLRITSDGNLKVCLFGNSEVSLRDMIRKDNEGRPMDKEAFEVVRQLEMNRHQGLVGPTEPSIWLDRETELLDIIGMAVKRKKEKHAGMGQLENMKNRPMILIGGNRYSRGPRLLRTARHKSAQKPDSARPEPSHNEAFSISGSVPQETEQTDLEESGDLHIATNDSSPVTRTVSSDSKDAQADSPMRWRGSRAAPRRNNEPRSVDIKNARPQRKFPSFSDSPAEVDSDRSLSKPWTKSTQPEAASASSPNLSSSSAPAPTPSLTHISPTGSISMVDVSSKPPTHRTAIAFGVVKLTSPHLLNMVTTNSLSKGNVLTTAQIAGIQAAKRTSDLIPLCHPLPLSHVNVECTPCPSISYHKAKSNDAKATSPRRAQVVDRVEIVAAVSTMGNTGVEMEALAAVMGAGLTVVDMCKAVDRGMQIDDATVIFKAGGRSGRWRREARWCGNLLRGLVERGMVSGDVMGDLRENGKARGGEPGTEES
ncbi:putative MoaC family protein [Elsinoe australis]|uniref:Putative MoaC family protein n=1 Tax=Elsinoe australis TaxID=40998 RepID=A0A4U7AWH1_9PEZI|nr:putative MoaC family protein [Elsinoe australis]